MSELPGYKKLPGKSRRYSTPSGDTISRRQYENLRFKRSGWSSWSEYQRTARNKKYKNWLRSAAGVDYDTQVPKGFREPDSEFNQAYLKARDSNWDKHVGGAFDKFLQTIGLRQPDWGFDVGDTPGGKTG